MYLPGCWRVHKKHSQFPWWKDLCVQTFIFIYYLLYLDKCDSVTPFPCCSPVQITSFLYSHSTVLQTVLLSWYSWFCGNVSSTSVFSTRDDWSKIIQNVAIVLGRHIGQCMPNWNKIVLEIFFLAVKPIVQTIEIYNFSPLLFFLWAYLRACSVCNILEEKTPVVLTFGNSCSLILLILNSSFNSSFSLNYEMFQSQAIWLL